MPSILVQLYPEMRDCRLYRYRLANCDIASDVPFTQLAPFSVPDCEPQVWLSSGTAGPGPEPGERWGVVYDGRGWIGGGWQPVTCRAGTDGMRVQIQGAGEFLISTAGDSIRRMEPAPETISDLLVEALLGPAMILALALQGIWCLHASAAIHCSRLAIFLGDSGAGKSTLASYLHHQQGAGWQRVADDILPVVKTGHGLPAALPHFPQLKLLQPAQVVDQRMEQVTISAIYLLVNPPVHQEDVSLRPLAGREAISALLRHTVAARLMPPALLAKHMDFCAWVSHTVPIRVLNYPHQRSNLPAAQELLAEDLAG